MSPSPPHDRGTAPVIAAFHPRRRSKPEPTCRMNPGARARGGGALSSPTSKHKLKEERLGDNHKVILVVMSQSIRRDTSKTPARLPANTWSCINATAGGVGEAMHANKAGSLRTTASWPIFRFTFKMMFLQSCISTLTSSVNQRRLGRSSLDYRCMEEKVPGSSLSGRHWWPGTENRNFKARSRLQRDDGDIGD